MPTSTPNNRALGLASHMMYVFIYFPLTAMRYFSLVIFSLVVLSACTPEQKVRNMELKQERLRETSGYNACMVKAKKVEDDFVECVTQGIIDAGYTDGIKCVGSGMDDSLCTDTERYKVEVLSYNACLEKQRTEITQGDCVQLLLDAQ